MNIDLELKDKTRELAELKHEIDKLDLMHEIKPGEAVHFNTVEEVMQSGELHIMEEIAIAEFNLLLFKQHARLDDKPLTWKVFIKLKKHELEEHRELQSRHGYALTDYEFQPAADVSL